MQLGEYGRFLGQYRGTYRRERMALERWIRQSPPLHGDFSNGGASVQDRRSRITCPLCHKPVTVVGFAEVLEPHGGCEAKGYALDLVQRAVKLLRGL